jgi:hypothetical protein
MKPSRPANADFWKYPEKYPLLFGTLQTGLILLAVIFCLRGQGSILANLGLAFAIPLFRLIFDHNFRNQFGATALRHWKTLNKPFSPDQTMPWKPVILFIVLPSAVLFSIRGFVMASADSRPIVMTAVSIISDRDIELSEYVEPGESDRALPYILTKTRSGIFSNYPSGPVLFALPVTVAAKLAGAQLEHLKLQNRLEKITALLVASVSLGIFFLVALHVVSAGPALMVTTCLALGSVFTTTVSQALWQHGGVIFCLMGILVSPGRGLLVYQPWALLAPVALLPFARKNMESKNGLPKGWMAFCWSVVLLLCAMASSWGMWWGGYSWGFEVAFRGCPPACVAQPSGDCVSHARFPWKISAFDCAHNRRLYALARLPAGQPSLE